MTTQNEKGSARIYQFPVKHRAAAGGRRDAMEATATPALPMMACGEAWYHGEAIEDAQRSRRSASRFPTR